MVMMIIINLNWGHCQLFRRKGAMVLLVRARTRLFGHDSNNLIVPQLIGTQEKQLQIAPWADPKMTNNRVSQNWVWVCVAFGFLPPCGHILLHPPHKLRQKDWLLSTPPCGSSHDGTRFGRFAVSVCCFGRINSHFLLSQFQFQHLCHCFVGKSRKHWSVLFLFDL
jgi:hypothetical protein